MINDLPTGTITFLFTDIEGSTQLWEQYPEAMKAALARHDELLREAIESHHGRVVKTTGDGAYAVFASAADGVAAALAIQLALHADNGPQTTDHSQQPENSDPSSVVRGRRTGVRSSPESAPPVTLKVRIGLHTGEAELRDGDYHGTALNRAARIMSIGHGGQVLLSAAAAGIARDALPPDVTLRDMGEHRLRGLARPEQVFQLVATGLPNQYPPLRSGTKRVVSLPQPPTGFIGRRDEVDDILRLLDQPDARLVTLIGPGGMGKTRLGIQAAATLAEREPDRFPDGVFFIPLAPLNAADGMAGAIAGALGFQFSQGEREPHEQLGDYLRERKALLLLDNIEHLIDSGGATLPAGIAATARDVSILVTSRARLGIQGEQLYAVPGMRVPDATAIRQWTNPAAEAQNYSALRLFAQTAGRIRPDFRLTRDNIADVARICRLVQGMPLGIILAANWLELLSTAEIAAEIERSLDLLATELRDVPERQRSMRAVFDTSWQLASEREREILPGLSFFRAPFTREAAEAVAGAGLRDLMALVNKSWLQRIKGGDGLSRFVMHELLRQYAQQMGSNEGDIVPFDERYARYYVTLVEQSKPLLLGAAQKEALATLAADFEHIRATWDWLVRHGEFDTLVDRMLRSLQRYAHMHGQYRAIGNLVDQALSGCRRSAKPCSPRIRVALLVVNQNMNYGDKDMSSHSEEAWQLADGIEEPERVLGIWYALLLGMRLYHDPQVASKLLKLAEIDDSDGTAAAATHTAGNALSIEAENHPALEQSVVLLRQAAAMVQQRGDQWAYAQINADLAFSLGLLGHEAEALALLDQSQAVYEDLGDWQHVAILAFRRSDFALGNGRPDLALEAWEKSVAISQDRGDRVLETLMLGRFSIELVRYGNIDDALRLRERSLALTRELAYTTNEPWNLWELGEVYRVAGSPAQARRFYEEARALFQAQGNRMGLAYHRRGLGDLALTVKDFHAAADQFAAAVDYLRDFPHETWSQVYMTNGLARAYIGLAHYSDALVEVKSSLTVLRRYTLLYLHRLLLATVAELALARDRAELTASLCGLLAADPLTWNEIRPRVSSLMFQARATVGDEKAGEAEARGRLLDAATATVGLSAITSAYPDEWLEEAMKLLAVSPISMPNEEP